MTNGQVPLCTCQKPNQQFHSMYLHPYYTYTYKYARHVHCTYYISFILYCIYTNHKLFPIPISNCVFHVIALLLLVVSLSKIKSYWKWVGGYVYMYVCVCCNIVMRDNQKSFFFTDFFLNKHIQFSFMCFFGFSINITICVKKRRYEHRQMFLAYNC